MQNKVNDILNEAWLLRMGGDVTAAANMLSRYLNEIDCHALQTSHLIDSLLAKKVNHEKFADVLVLKISIERRQYGPTWSVDKLKEIRQLAERQSIPLTFHYSFESGLVHLNLEHIWTALHAFNNAIRLTNDDFLKACAECNATLCMEQLNLNWKSRAESLQDHLQTLGASYRNKIQPQLRALQQREDFRTDLGVKREKALDRMKGTLSQETYQRLYFDAVTALQTDRQFSIDLTKIDYSAQYLGSYRYHTLSNMMHPHVSDPNLKLSEIVQRFYLWTWRWLRKPTVQQVARLTILVESIADRQGYGNLMAMHMLMMTNAVGWLRLFLKRTPSGLFHGLSSEQHAGTRLMMESQLLTIVNNLRLDDEILIKDPITAFEQQFGKAEHFADLRKFLSNTIDQNEEQGSAGSCLHENAGEDINLIRSLGQLSKPFEKNISDIHVDLARFCIHGRDGRLLSDNPVDSILLYLLTSYLSLSVYEVYQNCFGLRYHAAEHCDSKVANLLHRVNKFLPKSLRLKRKHEYIYLTGQVRTSVSHKNSHSKSLVPYMIRMINCLDRIEQRSLDSEDIFIPKRQSNNHSEASNVESYSRKELEAILGTSRSSTLRVIRELRKQDYISVEGQGKSSKYKLSEDIQKLIHTDQIHNAIKDIRKKDSQITSTKSHPVWSHNDA